MLACTQEHLKRHVLRAWFRTAMQDHRVTVNVRAAQAVEQAKHGLAGQFMGHIDELRCVWVGGGGGVICSLFCMFRRISIQVWSPEISKELIQLHRKHNNMFPLLYSTAGSTWVTHTGSLSRSGRSGSLS